jgi:hypothetical protein
MTRTLFWDKNFRGTSAKQFTKIQRFGAEIQGIFSPQAKFANASAHDKIS